MKPIFPKLIVAISAAISLSACVTTDANGVRHNTAHRTAISGERTRVGFAYYIAPDCSVISIPSAKIVKEPQHGRIESVRETGYPRGTGERRKCNSTKVSGLAGYYTSDKGFAGKDSLTARISTGNGTVSETVST